MRSSAESCGGIGFFGHSTFVQPQAVVTSIRTSGCSEVLVARRETWRVVPSRTSPSDSIECSNLSASSVSTSGLSKSTVCSNAAALEQTNAALGSCDVRQEMQTTNTKIPQHPLFIRFSILFTESFDFGTVDFPHLVIEQRTADDNYPVLAVEQKRMEQCIRRNRFILLHETVCTVDFNAVALQFQFQNLLPDCI